MRVKLCPVGAVRGRHNGALDPKAANVPRSSHYPLLALAALFAAFTAVAADLPPDVLARNRWMDLTRADYEAMLARVPENLRQEFGANPKRVQTVLNNLLIEKTLAAQARAEGTQPPSRFGVDSEADPQQALAAAEIGRIESDAGKSFDARAAAYEAKAREIYALDRDKYRVPEEVRLSDIAVKIEGRGEDAALARAREARQRVMAGASFADVAREYSDDPVTREKGGALPFVSAKSLAPGYSDAVFALSGIGEVSQPIKAPSAYHVVRLEERRPAHVRSFDEVRPSIMQSLRERYVAEQRDARVQSIHRDPDLKLNQPAIDALVSRLDPNAFKPLPADSAAPGAHPVPSAAK